MKIQFPLLMVAILFIGFRQRIKEATHESIKIETEKIYDKLVKIRRDLHENPELAGHEQRTQQIVKQYLLDLGLQVQTDIYGYGVIGILEGTGKGKHIAWRADMDALPNDFSDPVEFKSKIKGVQHGCGHDIHVAIGLGIAEIMAKNKASLNGTMYFIFQPEEETFIGAKGMIRQGLLSKIRLDEIYGLHVTSIPVGNIMVKPNEMFAYQKRIRIKLKNELSRQEAKALSRKIYSSLSRSVNHSKPWEIQHMGEPEIGLMNPNTIFKNYTIVDQDFRIHSEGDELFLEAYIYETDQRNLGKIIPRIERVIREQHGDKLLSVHFTQENPTVGNNEKLTKKAVKILTRAYGTNLILPDYGQVPYFNDDFAYFQQKVPGVYFFLGASNVEKGIIAMNHAPNFSVDEECIKIGVRSFSSLLIERMRQK